MCLLPWCINFTSTAFRAPGASHAISVPGVHPSPDPATDLDQHCSAEVFHARTVIQAPGLGSVVREASSTLREKVSHTRTPCIAKLTSAAQDLLDALARFSYFDRWSDEQRRDCCHRAQIRQFEPDQTVFVEGQAPVNYAHFMLSGECGLLQCLKLHRCRDRRTGAKRYRLSRAQPTEDEITRFHRRRQQPADACRTEERNAPSATQQTPAVSREPSRPTKVEYHFVDIATYSRGSVFGIGEHMVDRAVFARTRVQCLLIPRYWLLEKPQNRGNIWNRIRIFLEQRQPSRERLFRWFLAELLWHRYRKQLVDDFRLVHAPRHLPRLIDVPLACRIEECDVQTEAD